MVTKQKPVLPDKEIVKKLSKPVKSKKTQRYVAQRNIKKMEDAGWKKTKPAKDKHERVLGVKVSALGKSKYEPAVEPVSSDLVLMEK